MNILVIGQGGREHALCWKLSESNKVEALYCAPGNAGIAEVAQCIAIAEHDTAELIRFAKERDITFTVVGPEAPLLGGIVDAFEEAGLAIVGPRQNAALLEGSKAFAKEMMTTYRIPTARHQSFSEYQEALAYVRTQDVPIVIKADGLAAGKGVVVAHDRAEAETALERMMVQSAFGEAGARVVIEECLSGQEVSLLAFVDGETVRPMPPAQDHKPIFDSDRGPNTGGMGAYSPVPVFPEHAVEHATDTILKPIAKAMVQEGRAFRGILYAGLMLTPEGPKVIEFNARLGDPESQVILPRLGSDLADIFLALTMGQLQHAQITWRPEAAVSVVMASRGYPGSYPKGHEILGLEEAREAASAFVFHAGTKRQDERVVTSGGRVLSVTGLGRDLRSAREHAYAALGEIHFDGAQYRQDIAAKALAM